MAQRLRRSPNIVPTLAERLLYAGLNMFELISPVSYFLLRQSTPRPLIADYSTSFSIAEKTTCLIYRAFSCQSMPAPSDIAMSFFYSTTSFDG